MKAAAAHVLLNQSARDAQAVREFISSLRDSLRESEGFPALVSWNRRRSSVLSGEGAVLGM